MHDSIGWGGGCQTVSLSEVLNDELLAGARSRRHADLILLGLLLLMMMVLHLRFVDVLVPRSFLRSGVGVGRKTFAGDTKVCYTRSSDEPEKFGGNMVYQCHFHQCHSADLFRTGTCQS